MTKKQLEKDIEFLAKRQMKTSRINFLDKRDTGNSSNSIVGIAYGIIELKSQIMPSDADDMESCENMWKKLPEHRKQGDAFEAMKRARKHIIDKKAEYEGK